MSGFYRRNLEAVLASSKTLGKVLVFVLLLVLQLPLLPLFFLFCPPYLWIENQQRDHGDVPKWITLWLMPPLYWLSTATGFPLLAMEWLEGRKEAKA